MSAKKAKKEDADEAAPAPEGAEAAEGAEGEAAPKKGKKKLLIIIAVVVIALIGGAVAFMGGGGDEKKEAAHGEPGDHAEGGEHGEGAAVVAKPVYYELPEFLVNLSAGGNRVSFLKMSVTLELKDKAAQAVVKANKPRIVDTFNTYLRELRPTDVQGSAGIYRLKEELMTRINGTVEEGLVKDILFSQIIVQ